MAFFSRRRSLRRRLSWRSRRVGLFTDALFDAAGRLRGTQEKIRALAKRVPPRRILVTAVSQPNRLAELAQVLGRLKDSKHRVETSTATIGGRGKCENINLAIAQAGAPLSAYDWVVIADDDVSLPDRFLDNFIAIAEQADLALAQPAHRFRSYWNWEITQRRWGSIARTTSFVEIGPVTAVRRDVYEHIFPLPQLRWGWGLDVFWSQLSSDQGFRIGVVDGAPLQHLNPAAGGYGLNNAFDEAEAFLADRNVALSLKEVMRPGRIVIGW